MIEILILHILNRYDAKVYRIAKDIDEFFFAFSKSSTGTINPAMKRLEKINAVEFNGKMSDGGMYSKIYSITPSGKKHLKKLLLSFDEKNPYHVVMNASIAMYCSDVLSITELIEFKENMANVLKKCKLRLENGLKNEYISLNSYQKKVVETIIRQVNDLLELL